MDVLKFSYKSRSCLALALLRVTPRVVDITAQEQLDKELWAELCQRAGMCCSSKYHFSCSVLFSLDKQGMN